MSRVESSNGSRRFVPNKFKWAIRHFPPHCGRNARRLSEEERSQFLASRRESLAIEKPSQKEIMLHIGSSSGSKSKFHDLSLQMRVDKMENKSSSGPSNLYPSGHNHKLSKCDNRKESYRKRVTEAVTTFRDICNQLSKGKEEHDGEIKVRRMDCFAAKLMKEKGMYVHAGMKFVGCVPGIKLGDRFIYRMELAVVGLHSPPVAGIDYANENGDLLATSVVASKGYADDLQKPNELIYIGQGGMPSKKNKVPEDQKLVRGNLALMNSMRAETPVRVIRQEEEVRTRAFEYVYDGLYLVESAEKVPWKTGQLVFKFVLKRSSDQEYVRPCKVKK